MDKASDESEPLWVDRTGREYWCECEISDSHLLNIIEFLEKKIDSLPFPNFQGEIAQYMAEQEFSSTESLTEEKILELKNIARRRGIAKEER